MVLVGPVGSQMVPFGLVLSRIVPCGPVLSCIDLCGPFWPIAQDSSMMQKDMNGGV